jgi:hypothetical protein
LWRALVKVVVNIRVRFFGFGVLARYARWIYDVVSETSSVNSPRTPCQNPKTKKIISSVGWKSKIKTCEFHKICGISLPAEGMFVSQEGLYSIVLIG